MYEKYHHLLKTLSRAKPLHRKQLLLHAPYKLIKILSDVSLNILKGHITLTEKQQKSLQRKKKLLTVLSKKRVPLKVKRKLLIQRGGFLPALLAGLIPSILGLFIKWKWKNYLFNQRELENLQKPKPSTLDNEMRDILMDTTLSDYDKMLKYQHVLYKYLRISEQPKSLHVKEEVKPETDKPQTPETTNFSKMLPKSYEAKSAAILKTFARYPEKIKVYDGGQIEIKGHLIPNTNIVDLLKKTL